MLMLPGQIVSFMPSRPLYPEGEAGAVVGHPGGSRLPVGIVVHAELTHMLVGQP